MIKLNALTGTYIASTNVGNGAILYIYSMSISYDSTTIYTGGGDNSFGPFNGYFTSMSSSTLV